LTSQSVGRRKGEGAASWFGVNYQGRTISPSLSVRWKTNEVGFDRLLKANRVEASSGSNLGYIRFLDDYPVYELTDIWTDTLGQNQFGGPKTYVVQTALSAIQRCILMTTDPGDLVLDPTCGSGSTATVAEEWGRRWITMDTSRVALALARARIMGARYPYYLLADSREGQIKEGDVTRSVPSSQAVRNDLRHGFVYERVPHVMLSSIASNTEIDVIWEKWQTKLEPLLEQLNAAAQQQWQEWEIPRDADSKWPDAAKKLHAAWWDARIARQKEIDASIAAKAEFEYLYDKPYQDNKKVRVAGPFTVESLSPHRVLGVDENDELIDSIADRKMGYGAKRDFPSMILDNLRTAGVQQAHKEDRITFTALTPWPGKYICADGRYMESGESGTAAGETSSDNRFDERTRTESSDKESSASSKSRGPSPPQRGREGGQRLDEGESPAPQPERRAAIFIGPEFGTVLRSDLVDAAREAADAGFDVLIACAFNFEAHTTEFTKLGKVPVLKARMNADLHMAEDLKNTGKGNLFVIFGEPDIDILDAGNNQLKIKINGVDVFHPSTGKVESSGAEGIACWFIDTDYNEESFFVRHAYFLGQNDPYSALKTTLKAEINEEAWATLNSDTSRPFPKPANGRIAVKVINHLGDEVMKVFRVV
jgi:adenine-specific DNA-methyltransferase